MSSVFSLLWQYEGLRLPRQNVESELITTPGNQQQCSHNTSARKQCTYFSPNLLSFSLSLHHYRVLWNVNLFSMVVEREHCWKASKLLGLAFLLKCLYWLSSHSCKRLTLPLTYLLPKKKQAWPARRTHILFIRETIFYKEIRNINLVAHR